ncbi:EscI/YscI/HrpB family type III secretion system inner rod protein [Trinickia symbiotica]|uniref:EscI/YscI/HrpB family type III secretion system inner rod protein n=1 Tax=Trinickia symbiotica TaxID=863227 RepID=A0A2T3XQ03_9BURK|nr:type III secretion system inner rod subunit SctI [Trinickia symbiotica]PTB18606.1 EscI/YscI/HrpB family type III secretion system inner rod protein [Trinickia symbiotica]
MDIDPTQATQTQRLANVRDSQRTPSAHEVDAFTQALFGAARQLPEDVVTSGLNQTSTGVDTAIRNAREPSVVEKGPIEMLTAQSTLLRAIVEVDLTAKVAGAVSQGINKLTSMQ